MKVMPKCFIRLFVSGITTILLGASVALLSTTGGQNYVPIPAQRLTDREESFEMAEMVLLNNMKKWFSLPRSAHVEFVNMNKRAIATGFSYTVWQDILANMHWHNTEWPVSSLKQLSAAVAAALGDGIIIEPVGSVTRLTSQFHERDLDLQVRRDPQSDRADVLFTSMDKWKVKDNLEKLTCLKGPVTIGNVAIKFTLEGGLPVDLVLANPRVEPFPKLRGGENFYENSARIIGFLKQTPAARAAVVGVKQASGYNIWFDILKGRRAKVRPKSILLEAIVWRLSANFSLTTDAALGEQYVATLAMGDRDRDDSVFLGLASNEWFQFFDHVMTSIHNWEKSPFGSDLREDLDKLPDAKREEYLQGFEAFQHLQVEGMYHFFWIWDIFRRSQNTTDPDIILDPVSLTKLLRSSFPWDF